MLFPHVPRWESPHGSVLTRRENVPQKSFSHAPLPFARIHLVSELFVGEQTPSKQNLQRTVLIQIIGQFHFPLSSQNLIDCEQNGFKQQCFEETHSKRTLFRVSRTK